MGRRGTVGVLLAVGALALVAAVLLATVGDDDAGERVTAGRAVAPPGPDATVEVTRAVRTLFLPGASAREKVEQIHHGEDLEAFIADGLDDPRAAALTLDVTEVDVDGDRATAHIDFFLGGNPAMGGAELALTHDGERWRVVRSSYCDLRATSSPPCPAAPTSATTPADTAPADPAVPPTVTASAPLVRGTNVTITLGGLQRFRGRELELTVRTTRPVETSGGLRPGYLGLDPGAVVDEEGGATLATRIPNSLSGEDDVIPIDPAADYVLDINARHGRELVSVPIRFEPAAIGEAYAVTAGRGPRECGGPPMDVGLAFDGRYWRADSEEHFPRPADSFAGTFTRLDERAGRYTTADGAEVGFHVAMSAYAC